MKIALAMIVKPDDAEAVVLSRCLNSVGSHVDGMFITQAGPKKNPAVSTVIKAHGAQESFYKWNDSFADARNYNFSQVPKEYDYILWLDADDVLRGGEKLRETVEANMSIDLFSLWYLYAFDEWKNPIVVHHKSRIIRNDKCVEWMGDLHEDFKENRNIMRKHINGIEVLHLTTEERVADSMTRNVRVSKSQLKNLPDDPRSYWNLGNSLKGAGEYKQALAQFQKFIKTSYSDDEKYIARLRMAECYYNLEDKNEAIEMYRYAIGLKPMYPDAYIQLGHVFYEIGRYDEAVPLLKQAMTYPPPQYSIVVYNPRDYDYTPLKWLGYCYLEIHQPMLAYPCFQALLEITPKDTRLKKIVADMKKTSDKQDKMLKKYAAMKEMPKDKMKKALDQLPDDYKSQPMFTNLKNVNFVKEKSSGKDIAIVCGFTTREWDPTSVKEGIGGSEEAVIHLARKYAEAGWNVTVFNNCGHKAKTFDGVTYSPFWTWNYRDKQDVTILWRHPKMLDYDINSTKIFIDVHDVIAPGEFNESRLAKLDKIFVKSKFHRSLFPDVPDDMFAIIPNGIDYETFKEVSSIKDPMLMINTSSPERSLSAIVRLFPRIKAEVPEVKMEWAYGWNGFIDAYKDKKDRMDWMDGINKQMEELGIVNHGRVSHEEVAEMYKRARVFAYPTEFGEIDCISARKAQAAGAIPVTTSFSALDETVQFGVKVSTKKTKDNWVAPYQFDFAMDDAEAEDQWVEAVIDILKTERNLEAEKKMNEWTKKFDWSTIAVLWLKEMV